MAEVTSSGLERNGTARWVSAALAVVLVLGFTGAFTALASADIGSGRAGAVQSGDNEGDTNQDGEADSGDVVVGQVGGVVSSGDASVDATNLSSDSDATSGDADGSNSATSSTGSQVIQGRGCAASSVSAQACGAGTDIDSLVSAIVQAGDNTLSIDQAFDVSSGDSIAGQVIGVVASGTADLVLANTSDDVDTTSGDGSGGNFDAARTSNLILFGPEGECCPLP
jgi:hypothetical protein